MVRFGPDETILHQPAGHFSPRRYVALAMQSAQGNGAAIALGTVRALHNSATGTEAELDDGRRLRAEAAIVASGAFAAGSDLLRREQLRFLGCLGVTLAPPPAGQVGNAAVARTVPVVVTSRALVSGPLVAGTGLPQ